MLDKTAYIAEMNIILSDTDTYVPLNHDSIFKYKNDLIKLIDQGFTQKLLDIKGESLSNSSGPPKTHYVLFTKST